MRFLRAEVGPGETAGALAARSVGGPAARMTLDAFRHGASDKNATTGVPPKEIVDAAETAEMPGPTICPWDDTSRDTNVAELCAP